MSKKTGRLIKKKLRYLKGAYTTQRDSFQETIPFGTLFWDILRIILSVAIISSLVIMLTGLTTPFVAVSSGSMEPNIMTGDLVIMISPDEHSSPISNNTIGTSTSSKTSSFNKQGNVIVFEAEQVDIPVIHRAHYHTEKNENWVKKVDSSNIPEHISCADIETCPAPDSGYITIGDNNSYYDQTQEYAIVTENDIIGVAKYRIPYIGWLTIFLTLPFQ